MLGAIRNKDEALLIVRLVAASHAAARGFIAPDAVDGISARCRRSWR
jgi:hypothetical protein